MLEDAAGTQFDSVLVRAFVSARSDAALRLETAGTPPEPDVLQDARGSGTASAGPVPFKLGDLS